MNSNSVIVPKYLLKCKSVHWQTTYDEKNFLYCVIRHLWPATVSIKHCDHFPDKYIRKFNLSGIKFPLNFKQINKFVKRNNHLPLTIRVFFESESEICVLDTFSNIRGRQKKYKNVLNVLLIKSDRELLSCQGQAGVTRFHSQMSSSLNGLNHEHHFFTIKNIRGFLNGRKQSLKQAPYPLNHYYCEVCLMNFVSKGIVI